MPIAILKFTLPEEDVEFRAATQGRAAKIALWDIDQRLRSLLKHGEPTEEEARLAEEIRNMIPYEMLDD
jgi:glutamate-1-semialdehyde aminotransferase